MPTPSVILDRKLRFAVVGCGRIAQSHFKALLQHASRAELVAVCDNRPDALAAAVATTGVAGFGSLRPACTRARPSRWRRPGAMW
jgi:UDP-N-acetyl-2-amino-2-deoxyglucuronate dehydrogenase